MQNYKNYRTFAFNFQRMSQMNLRIKTYPLSIIVLTLVWFLSFFTPPKTELDAVPFIDKWVHIVMYGGTTITIWGEYIFRHKRINWKKLVVWGTVSPIIMSGAIELLQEYCTPNTIISAKRSGDWLDIAANSTGVLLASIIMAFIASKRK